jgi:U3 small nucleolar RNA-associated protein 3
MGKKRKAGRRMNGQSSRGDDENVPAVQTKYDINEEFADSEDEFFAQRDRILLDEAPVAKRRRKIEEEERFLEPSDEEVLGYDEEDEDEDLNEDAEDFQDGDAEEQDENGSSAGSNALEEEEDNLRDWGTSRADYYNADVLETEADALAEGVEARRLQQKQLEAMTEADFGFEEAAWAQDAKEADAGTKGMVTEKLPEAVVTPEMGPEERLRLLNNRYPELEPLARDFTGLQELYQDLKIAAESVTKHQTSPRKRKLPSLDDEPNALSTSVAVIKFRALSAYLGSIAIYFSLVTSTASQEQSSLALPPAELREHAVIQTLVRCRQTWDKVKDLELSDVEDVSPEAEGDINGTNVSLANDHLDNSIKKDLPPPNKKRKTKAEKSAAKAQAVAEAEKLARIEQTEARLAGLSSSLRDSRRSLKKAEPGLQHRNGDVDSDFGDETPLTAEEAAEKAQMKKSLRFYTSQIAQKSNKRGAASRDVGGDTDLPHKERLKDRQARLMQEAEKRGKKDADRHEQLNGDDSGDDAEEARLAKEVRGDDKVEDADGYYDMIAAKTWMKKADKKARAEAYAEAAKQGSQVYVEEEVRPDGKRAVTYAIAKNKGLMPRRKKEVRNPRVKKRKKYDEKMKKLGSIRPLYKGGEGPGGYGGELTGIKKNLIKSVKL